MYSVKVTHRGRVLYLSYDTHSAASMVYFAIRGGRMDAAYLKEAVITREPRGHVLNKKSLKVV
jgi:hypothetical protein